ncbi:DUF4142 domain-containing protein [Nonomuraea sp. NN258]|uniref:DUF4142 domain-containing protein n=1 Tax=Nonomuraea antri TaxID=2730852 RepID=UPI001567F7EF|nr:DUF4142 domain-containing protein [Nonomuraea antri]NRQ39519.1 DUF4142 domain-containing protein [Nonomuraea antri]
MRTRLTLVLAVAAASVLAGCGESAPTHSAGLASPASPSAADQPSKVDRAWLKIIHVGNLAEIEAGRLAESKGASNQVKSIGKMLVDDHTELDTKVTEVAGKLGVQLPDGVTGKHAAVAKRLAKASGRDFDQEWIAAMTKAHTAALTATKKEASNGSSPSVVALAKSAIPALEDHLAALQKAG